MERPSRTSLHLGAYQPVFIGRLERINRESSPEFGRYVAEEDPLFSRTISIGLQPSLLDQIDADRARILVLFTGAGETFSKDSLASTIRPADRHGLDRVLPAARSPSLTPSSHWCIPPYDPHHHPMTSPISPITLVSPINNFSNFKHGTGKRDKPAKIP